MVVRNVEELVGPGPGPGATATVTVLVERVVPPPQLDQESYEASVPISTPAGSLLSPEPGTRATLPGPLSPMLADSDEIFK